MKASIHPVADQLAQFWISSVDRADPRLAGISPRAMSYAVLLALQKSRIPIVKRRPARPRAELWDPPRAFLKIGDLRAPAMPRRVFEVGKWEETPEMIRAFSEQLSEITTASLIEEAVVSVKHLFLRIYAGEVAIIGWDDDGQMELQIPATRRYS